MVVDLPTVIKHPLTILYFNGGVIGYWLGLSAVLLYILIKRVDSPLTVIASWMVTVLFYESVLHFLHEHTLFACIGLVLNIMIVSYFHKKVKGSGGEIWAVQLLVMFTLIQLLLNAIIHGFQFNTTTWTYLVMMTFLIFLNVRRKQNE
ncbi:hypothetical protein QTG56_08370 [Rossellomorea sp. AcN35-11]|nr:hypothetical protein QTG56_08370 [Rossellomorea sp. AcN35-11]